MTADSEVVEAIEIARKDGASLVVQGHRPKRAAGHRESCAGCACVRVILPSAVDVAACAYPYRPAMSPGACTPTVAASGDLSVVRPPEGDSEVEYWVVVYDYPSATEVLPGLQEQAAEQVRRRLLCASAWRADRYLQLVAGDSTRYLQPRALVRLLGHPSPTVPRLRTRSITTRLCMLVRSAQKLPLPLPCV